MSSPTKNKASIVVTTEAGGAEGQTRNSGMTGANSNEKYGS